MDAGLQRAIGRGESEAVAQRLDAGAGVNARDRHGQTAPMRAAHGGDAAMVALLLERGANPNVAAKYRLDALMRAVIAGHAEIARDRGTAELAEKLERG